MVLHVLDSDVGNTLECCHSCSAGYDTFLFAGTVYHVFRERIGCALYQQHEQHRLLYEQPAAAVVVH